MKKKLTYDELEERLQETEQENEDLQAEVDSLNETLGAIGELAAQDEDEDETESGED